METPEQRLSQRATDMCRRREKGETLAEIGEAFGLSRERVRRILAASGGPTPEEFKEQRSREKRETLESERDRLLAIMRANPGCTRQQLARISGTGEAKIHAILGEDHYLLVRENQRARAFSDEDIRQALREGVALAGEPLTSSDYESIRHQFGGPSSARVIQRFKTWAKACEFAGVSHGRPRRAEYKRRWTDAEMIGWAAAYFESEGCRGTYKDFSDWAASTAGAPSAQTVRNTIGSWTTVKRSALVLTNTPDSKGRDDEPDRR